MLRRRIDRGKQGAAVSKKAAEDSASLSASDRSKGIYHYINMIAGAADVKDTMSLIRMIDTVYNEVADTDFSQKTILEQVLAVTVEDLTEFDWLQRGRHGECQCDPGDGGRTADKAQD